MQDKAKECAAVQKAAYLDFVDEALGCALHPGGLFGLGKLLMTDKVIPALAPHIHVLAAITGTTLDLFHLIIGGRPGFLLLCCVTPGGGPRYYWPLDQTWGARSRRGSCSGRRGDFTPPGRRSGRRSSLL